MQQAAGSRQQAAGSRWALCRRPPGQGDGLVGDGEDIALEVGELVVGLEQRVADYLLCARVQVEGTLLHEWSV